jgi:hypothetical protein
VQLRRIEVEGDPVLFAMLSGLLEQTIRCRRLDVASSFSEAFITHVHKLKSSVTALPYPDSRAIDRLIELFSLALEGRLDLEQAREALFKVQLTDIIQRLFIQANFEKTWVVERLNDGTPVNRDDEVVIPWFCRTFGIDICIYWLEGLFEYERVEFFSPRPGMIVNIYQRLVELDTETGLLYFADYAEEALEPLYPNCCLASDLPKSTTYYSSNISPALDATSQALSSHSSSFQTSREPRSHYYRRDKQTVVGLPVVKLQVPPQAIDRLRHTLQREGLSYEDATHFIFSGPSAEKQLKPPQFIGMETGGVYRTSGMDCLAARERPVVPTLTPLPSHHKSVGRESLGISSLGMGSNPSLSQGQPINRSKAISSIPVLPSKPLTRKLPTPKQVKIPERKTSDSVVTRSLPPARVKIVPTKLCSSCQTDIIGFSYDCPSKCKVCARCLVRSSLPAKTCPGCRQITLSDEDVEIVEKLRLV